MAVETPSPSPNPGPADLARPGVPTAPLALYRRYRPASFAEVKGQDHVTEPLRQALRSGRVHHAYLFSGPRGCGKTSSARILARSLNCESGPTPDPCGVCASCVALAPTGPGSIDVIEIDAASHGGVDDARDLRERAFYAPVSGRFKIYIIDEAHMVTREGFNALLKLVEEPPPHLKFVFATTEPEKVIATIRSRTHHYPFRLVPPAVLRELLEAILGSEGVAYEPAVLPVVIRAGAGSVRDSLSVLDQLIAGSDDSGLRYERAVALLGYTDDALLDEVAEAFAAGDGAAVFRSIDRVVEGGHDPRRFAADLLDRFRDLIVLAAVPDAAATGLLDVPADRLDRMREQAAGFGQAQLVGAAETISAGLVEMRGATSPRLLLELMCAQVLLPAPDSGGKDVLARLERLERRLATGGGAASPVGQVSARATVSADPPAAGDSADPHRTGPDTSGRARGTTPDTGGPDTGGPDTRGPDTRGPDTRGPDTRGIAPDAGGRAGAVGPDAVGRAAGVGPEAGARAGEGAPEASGREAGGAPDTVGGNVGGEVDADAIRERWDAVLDAVKHQRKVSWLLLSNATVDSLADGVLTLMFAREGEARGFAGSEGGHLRALGQVLQAMFGIAPQIRAAAATGPGGAGPGSAGQGSAGQGGAGHGHAGQGGSGHDYAGQGYAGQDYAGPGGAGPGGAGPGGAGPGGAGPGHAGPGSAGQDGAGHGHAGQGGSGPGNSGPGSGSVRQGRAAQDRSAAGASPGREAPGGGQDQAAGTGTPSRVSTRVAQAYRPTSGADPAGASYGATSGADTVDATDAEALSGMDLIERELGGQIIQEIGEE